MRCLDPRPSPSEYGHPQASGQAQRAREANWAGSPRGRACAVVATLREAAAPWAEQQRVVEASSSEGCGGEHLATLLLCNIVRRLSGQNNNLTILIEGSNYSAN